MSVTPVSSIPVSVDYTGRDYYSLRDQVIARIQSRIQDWKANDPSDFGVALAESFSYLGDVLSYYIDRTANEAFLETATQRESLLAIAASYGYSPAGYRQAYVGLTFSNTSDADVTIPEGSVVTGDVISGDVVNTLYFTTLAEATVPAAVGESPGTVDVTAAEGRYVTLVSATANTYGDLIGTSTGEPDMLFELTESPVVDGTIEVYVQDGDVYSKWSSVTHLLDYGPSDLVFCVITDENNSVFVQFGDGVSGAIPVPYSEIRSKYMVGGGSVGNVPADTLTTIDYIPGLSESQVTALQADITVTNGDAAIGGADPESNAQIRTAAPLSLRALNRAVTLEDFESLAYAVSGIGKAKATASTWTSVTLYIAPSRNAEDTDPAPGLDDLGNPTAEFESLQSNVETFLLDKLLIGSSVTIQPPTYVDVVVNLQYTKLPQYTTTEVETAIKTTLLTAFGYTGVSFADTIYPQDIEFEINQVNGVKTCKVLALHVVAGSGLNTLQGAADEIFRFTEANVSLSEM